MLKTLRKTRKFTRKLRAKTEEEQKQKTKKKKNKSQIFCIFRIFETNDSCSFFCLRSGASERITEREKEKRTHILVKEPATAAVCVCVCVGSAHVPHIFSASISKSNRKKFYFGFCVLLHLHPVGNFVAWETALGYTCPGVV